MSKENIASEEKDIHTTEAEQNKASEIENQEKAEDAETPEEQPELSKEEELQRQLDEKDNKYLRLFAEFENYKRRTSKERVELFKTASQDVMQSMLPILDDFDRAMAELKKSEDDSLIQGIELINNKLRETLKSKGLEVMPVSPGEVFDSELHEAITQIPAPSEDMKGKIIDVVEQGYTLGDKIIRYPKVVTGK